jgi:hypothetical protein
MVSAFELNTAQVHGDPTGTYSYRLRLLESSYPYGEVRLSSEYSTAHALLADAEFSLFGRPVPVYLQALPSLGLSGTVDAIAITPEFWEISAEMAG